MKWITTLLFCTTLLGCATVGREISQTQIDTLKQGETTIDQAITTLGQPTTITRTADGRRILAYSFAHAQARPASFIPFVGAFAGGADVRSSLVLITFDSAGILQNYQASQSTTGSGTGFSAGGYMPPDPTLPQEAKRP